MVRFCGPKVHAKLVTKLCIRLPEVDENEDITELNNLLSWLLN